MSVDFSLIINFLCFHIKFLSVLNIFPVSSTNISSNYFYYHLRIWCIILHTTPLGGWLQHILNILRKVRNIDRINFPLTLLLWNRYHSEYFSCRKCYKNLLNLPEEKLDWGVHQIQARSVWCSGGQIFPKTKIVMSSSELSLHWHYCCYNRETGLLSNMIYRSSYMI